MKELLERIYPLHRTLASDGTEQALKIIGEYLPEPYRILNFNPGDKAWTWTIPPKYIVREAYIEMGGRRIVDFARNCLHLVSYSESLNRNMSWNELAPHLHTSSVQKQAIPWRYSFYRKSWGFCLSQEQLDQLPHDAEYHVVIDIEYDMAPGAFKIGEFWTGKEPNELMVLAHICHPNQANDDAAGVAVAVEVARRLVAHPLPEDALSVRFLFVPETIGTIAYLARHKNQMFYIKGGIFIEQPGAGGTIAMQHTLEEEDELDEIGARFARREVPFASLAANDERVLSGPNVNIPCISFTRAPFPEYHTSADNLDIIRWDYMQEMADAVENTVRMYASNYVPKPLFTGPAFLSAYGLFVDWQADWQTNRLIEGIMMAMTGWRSVFKIAQRLNADYWQVHEIVERFVEKGLVERSII